MKNLKEKINDWNIKVEKGNDKYVKIAPCKNEMIYMYYRNPYFIQNMRVLTDTGDGFKLHYFYDAESPVKSEFGYAAIIKERKAIIIDDEKFGYYAFGMKDLKETSPVKSTMIYIRTEYFHSIIMADDSNNSVMMLEDLTANDVSASDAISVCIAKLLAPVGIENNSDGGTDEIR